MSHAQETCIQNEETCPHCKRTESQCEKETDNEKNPITYWVDWGLSCDDCWYAAHPESEDDESESEDDESD